MKYAIVTFGCRVNQADSLGLEDTLRLRGAEPAPAGAADLVVINTCSVTAAADQGARQVIRRVARDNPSAKIVVTGCYATREPADLASLPGVIRVVANGDKARLVEAIGDWVPGAAVPGSAFEVPGAGFEITRSSTEPSTRNPAPGTRRPAPGTRTTYTLRVQTGCEERCAYCIIPSTRGRSQSVPIFAVLEDVRRVERAGFREVALTGVHLGSYGRDLEPACSLLDLLRALDDLPGDTRFRISSLEPMDCPAAVVDLVARAGRFEPHFHLPLQHASDRMLRLMRRPYTLDAYRHLVGRIRNRLPHAAIGSDLIAGFPGETDEDFAANEAYLPSSPLTHLHVFPYSDRPGTAASGMGERVSGAVTRARAARLRETGATLARGFCEAQIHTVRPGLTLEDGTLVVTDNYLKVRIPAGHTRNVRVDVLIEEIGAEIRGRVAQP